MNVPSAVTSTPSLSVDVSVGIAVPAARAWELIRDFDRVGDWHPMVARTRVIHGTNNTPGAVRHLTFLDGSTLEEELTAYCPREMKLQYIITAGGFPVRNYSTTLSVTAISAQESSVRWAGIFDRADPASQPVE